MNKPIILAMEEAESIMTSAVNQILASGVTPYFAEIVVEKVHSELRNLAKNEIQQAKINYSSALEAEKNKGEETPLQDNKQN